MHEDILGNGRVHPADLVDGSGWYRLFKGTEVERVARRMALAGGSMRAYFPTQRHLVAKRQKYLYKYFNLFRRNKRVWWWNEDWPYEPKQQQHS